jgi:hypothetical protein
MIFPYSYENKELPVKILCPNVYYLVIYVQQVHDTYFKHWQEGFIFCESTTLLGYVGTGGVERMNECY